MIPVNGNGIQESEAVCMMKLNILNMERFLDVVNSCEGAVYQIGPDGSRIDLRRAYRLQDDLRVQYRQNRGELPLTLVVPNGRDYLRVVYYYAGDC